MSWPSVAASGRRVQLGGLRRSYIAFHSNRRVILDEFSHGGWELRIYPFRSARHRITVGVS